MPVILYTGPRPDHSTIVTFGRNRDAYPYESVVFMHGHNNHRNVTVSRTSSNGTKTFAVTRQEAAKMIKLLRHFNRDLWGDVRLVY